MIQCKDIRKSYGTLEVLRGVSLEVSRGEVVSIVGASGAGKTTLLQVMGTLSRQDSGTVQINGIDVSRMRDRELSDFRNAHIGFVFQFHHLLPEFTAFENICIPGLIGHRDRREVERRAAELIDMMGLGDRRNHKPTAMSGGEQQRVAIARALAKNPKILLCDEPTGALDFNTGITILKLLHDTCKNYGKNVIVITHNQAITPMADRVITMKSGRVVDITTNENPVSVDDIEW